MSANGGMCPWRRQPSDARGQTSSRDIRGSSVECSSSSYSRKWLCEGQHPDSKLVGRLDLARNLCAYAPVCRQLLPHTHVRDY